MVRKLEKKNKIISIITMETKSNWIVRTVGRKKNNFTNLKSLKFYQIKKKF